MRGLQVPPAKHAAHAQGKNKVRVSRTILVSANLRRHLDSSLRSARRIAADWLLKLKVARCKAGAERKFNGGESDFFLGTNKPPCT